MPTIQIWRAWDRVGSASQRGRARTRRVGTVTANETWPPCQDCGAPNARTLLGEDRLCDRCLNERISVQTGWSRLPDPPGPEEVVASDGRRISFRYRLTWAPSGVLSAEAEEASVEPGDGYRY